MEKRVLLATVLSTLVIIFWWLWMSPSRRNIPGEQTISKQIPQEKITSPVFEKKPADVPAAFDGTSEIKDFVYESKHWKIVLNSLGAKIKHYYLKESNEPKEWTDMIAASDGKNLATFPETNFKLISESTYKTETITVSFMAELAKTDIKIYKTYQLQRNGYLHKLKLEIINQGNLSENLPLNVLWGPGLGTDASIKKQENIKCRAVVIKKTIKNDYKLSKLKPGDYSAKECTWLGMDNTYFVIGLMNKDFDSFTVSKNKEKGSFNLNLNKQCLIPAKSKISYELPFYFGPKLYSELQKLNYGLETVVSFGVFAPLSKLFFNTLKQFYKITGNYGVSIIMLTIILQIITLPLTWKSHKASKAMKMLQPKMKELQEKYKSDSKRLNTEMLHLYKSQKVNPLGGCLPMLLQLPIFWGLFVTLRNIYELRGAPFMFWITDLSSPDLLFSIGNIPVRVLPLLMGGTMFLQQKFSGAGMAPSQKTMMYVMPIVFTIIFLNFPSGLVLYWLVNNILSIVTQHFVHKRK